MIIIRNISKLQEVYVKNRLKFNLKIINDSLNWKPNDILVFDSNGNYYIKNKLSISDTEYINIYNNIKNKQYKFKRYFII